MGHYCFTLLVILLVYSLIASNAAAQHADSTHAQPSFERPRHPKLIIETDQRFYYLLNSRTNDRSPQTVNQWGIRGGLLFPAGFKGGFGYYFINQYVPQPNLFGDTYSGGTRRVQYVTAYYEPYFFRKPLWEFSTPLELGLGRARYQLTNNAGAGSTTLQGNFVPLSIGISVSGKLPATKGIRVFRWFGLNIMTGYRFTVKKDFPQLPVNYNGIYFSVSPAIFLDRISDDVTAWLKRRKARKQATQ